MNEGEKRLRMLGWALGLAVVITLGLTVSSYTNYLGLLESMSDVIFNIDDVTHHLKDDKIEFVIDFSVLNPTNYDKLKFSSLQCQIYIVDGAEEIYLGATGYAPPVDIPLKPKEPRNYTTTLSVSGNNLLLTSDSMLNPVVSLRVRNVIFFTTPIRKYYQSINVNIESLLE